MLTELFGFAKSTSGAFKPLLLILILMLILAPKDANVTALKKYATAVFSYLMMSIGVVLMSFGAIPSITAVLSSVAFTPEQYLGLLLMFAAGGILYLWTDQQVRLMDPEAKKVPSVVFHFAFKMLGYLSILFAAVAVAMAVAFQATATPGWWSIPVITLIYGSVLCWATASEEYRLSWVGKNIDAALSQESTRAGKGKKKQS